MTARRWPLVWGLAVVATLACAAASEPAPERAPESPVHRFTDNWGDSGCTPKGATLTLVGRVVVRPFGKGSDGAVLRESPSQEWILSYRAEGVLLELDGARVEATGRVCDKQYEAIFGDHFDLETIRRL